MRDLLDCEEGFRAVVMALAGLGNAQSGSQEPLEKLHTHLAQLNRAAANVLAGARRSLPDAQGAARSAERNGQTNVQPADLPLLDAIFTQDEQQWIETVRSRTGHILIVDDDPINRAILVRHVTRNGHTTLQAADGVQALQMMREHKFDTVLLDLMMPNMNGYDVLQTMREDPALRHIPAIMISAVDDLDNVVRCIELGAQDYLGKPFNPVLLRARIDSSLQAKYIHDIETDYLNKIEAERNRADQLVNLIFPNAIVSELKTTKQVKPRRHEDVAVFFLDLVGFTHFCDNHQPEDAITQLQELVDKFESIAAKHSVDKTKTIGDAFMACCGLLSKPPNPVLNCIKCGLEMITAARESGYGWQARAGIHLGPVMAGVVGKRQYLFDLWGDTVNTASRVESNAAPGTLVVSASAWNRVKAFCEGESLGNVQLKGKGPLELYTIKSVR